MDGVTTVVDAVVYYSIRDPVKSIIRVANPHSGTSRLAQTALRNVLGTKSLMELLTDREGISEMLKVRDLFHLHSCSIAPTI